jgi:hypothetical protein
MTAMESADLTIAQSPVCDRVDANSCGSSVCQQPPQAVIGSEEAIATHLATMQHAAVLITALFLPVPKDSSRWRIREATQLRAPLLVSLQTIIRV